jgi:hypothetical protein
LTIASKAIRAEFLNHALFVVLPALNCLTSFFDLKLAIY